MVKQVVEGLWQVPLGPVNSYLADNGGELVVIDTGLPGNGDKLEAAILEIGRRPGEVRSIIVTHAHPDHDGSAAALRRVTGASIYMHDADAPLLRKGVGLRPLRPSPGMPGVIFRIFIHPPATVEAAPVEGTLTEGERGPGGFRIIHVPGHCAGQVALLWERAGGVLIAADTSANQIGLGISPAYEDLELGKRSLARLADMNFEVAVFGHGRPILKGAAALFRAKFGGHAVPVVAR